MSLSFPFRRLLPGLLIALFVLPGGLQARSVPSLLTDMVKRARSVRTLRYTIRKWERIGGSLYYEQNLIKLKRSPLKVYLRQIKPKEGIEVLYRSGVNGNKLLVNPNGPPYFNLNLSVNSGQVRKNQHHNILDIGFDHFTGIIEHIIQNEGEKLRYDPPRAGTWNGREGQWISLYNSDFGLRDYRVGPGENLFTIARKLKVNEYMILENNPSLGGYTGIPAGTTIRVPNSYAQKTLLFLDRQTGLPLAIQIYDPKGLFEKYEYYDFHLNPEVKESEFTPEFPEYNF